MDLNHIAQVRAEYEAATIAWDATHAVVRAARTQHMKDGDYAPLAAALAAHAPNAARLDAAFAAMADLPEDADIEAFTANELARSAQGTLI